MIDDMLWYVVCSLFLLAIYQFTLTLWRQQATLSSWSGV